MEIKRLTSTELVREHQADVWRYLRYLGCDRSHADDLTQETFLAVFRKPFEQRSRAETAAYLRTVARRQLLMAARRRKTTVSADDLQLAESVWVRATADEPFDDYLDALERCLENLTDRAQRAIHLRYHDELSRDAMAEQLEMTSDGVKTLLRRTRETLRECVERKAES